VGLEAKKPQLLRPVAVERFRSHSLLLFVENRLQIGDDRLRASVLFVGFSREQEYATPMLVTSSTKDKATGTLQLTPKL
jgi:hypothetical protein